MFELKLTRIPKQDIKKPKKYEPPSPIKINAGCLLYWRKPIQLPIVMQLKKQEYKSWFRIPNIKKPVQVIIVMPAANPSRPSIQFKALVIATIQNKVNKKPIDWLIEKEGIISL